MTSSDNGAIDLDFILDDDALTRALTLAAPGVPLVPAATALVAGIAAHGLDPAQHLAAIRAMTTSDLAAVMAGYMAGESPSGDGQVHD